MDEFDRLVIIAAAERCERILRAADGLGLDLDPFEYRPQLMLEFAACESALAFYVARNGSSLLLFPAGAA